MLENFYTIREVSQKLKVSDQLIYKLIRENKFPYKKIGTRVIIAESELQTYLNKNSVN